MIPAEAVHPIERMSDGGAEACIVCGKPSEQAVSHWECERQLLRPTGTQEGGRMSYTIKAAALSRAHLGEQVTISRDGLTVTDTLSGVSHEADLIEESSVGVEVFSYSLGRIETRLVFVNAGRVQVAGDADVTISGTL